MPWLLLLLALLARGVAGELRRADATRDALSCVYRDWMDAGAGGQLSAAALADNTKCCKDLVFNASNGVRRLWTEIITYTPLVKDSNTEKRTTCYIRNDKYITRQQLRNFVCKLSEEYSNTSSIERLRNINVDSVFLNKSDSRKNLTSQMFQLNERVVIAALTRQHCFILRNEDLRLTRNTNSTERQKKFLEFKNMMSTFLGNHMQSVSLSLEIVGHLYVPYAYDHMVGSMPKEQIDIWFTSIEKVKEWLHVRIRSYISDVINLSKTISTAQLLQDPNAPANYTLRWPYPHGVLLSFGDLESARSDCYECCSEQTPQFTETVKKMSELEDNFYETWLKDVPYDWLTNYVSHAPIGEVNPKFKKFDTGETWLLADQSNTTVSVDMSCMLLMKNLIDNPKCFFGEVPKETRQMESCRRRLADDLRDQKSYVPVTSYLAYSPKVRTDLCLLSWMVANSNSICGDVPPSFSNSAQAAHCVFNDSSSASCQSLSFVNVVCSISRELLWFKCKKYVPQVDDRELKTDDILFDYKLFMETGDIDLDSTRYLLPLEIALISLNIFFRLLTAGLFIYLSQLGNRSGKLLLGFQITGILQVFFTEVIYRLGGLPEASAAQLDSSFTLLTCVWLSTFCFEVFQDSHTCRIPRPLQVVGSKQATKRYVICALIPWVIVSSILIALERAGGQYKFVSGVLFLVAVSLTVVFNLSLLCLIAYNFNRSKYYVLQNEWISPLSDKKKLAFMIGKSFVLSGVGIAIRLGLQQVEDVAEWVYYVHLATMFQGPLLFVLFVCDDVVLPLLKKRVLGSCCPVDTRPQHEVCSSVNSFGTEILPNVENTSV